MGWACCGLQASPLFCFMQSRSAGCGRNAQARSTPLSKAFLADKLATSALLRLILTKPTQGCSSQGTQRPCGGSWEDAGAPSARPEPWRCPAVLQAACGAPPAQSSPRTGSPKGARRSLAPPELPPSRGSGYTQIAGRCALAARPEPRQLGRGRGRPHTYPLSASCPPPCPRLLARLERLSLALTPSVCPAAAAPAWDAHSTATPRAIPSSRPRHIASPEPSGCERPLPPLRRRRPPVPAALSPTSLSNASCEGEKRRKRSQ